LPLKDSLGTSPISFNLRYPGEGGPALTYVTKAEGTAPPECPGEVGEPAAAPGNLCVYEETPTFNGATFEESSTTPTIDPFGVTLFFSAPEPFGAAVGNWVVTAPTS
jgi:hypothetical protein